MKWVFLTIVVLVLGNAGIGAAQVDAATPEGVATEVAPVPNAENESSTPPADPPTMYSIKDRGDAARGIKERRVGYGEDGQIRVVIRGSMKARDQSTPPPTRRTPPREVRPIRPAQRATTPPTVRTPVTHQPVLAAPAYRSPDPGIYNAIYANDYGYRPYLGYTVAVDPWLCSVYPLSRVIFPRTPTIITQRFSAPVFTPSPRPALAPPTLASPGLSFSSKSQDNG